MIRNAAAIAAALLAAIAASGASAALAGERLPVELGVTLRASGTASGEFLRLEEVAVLSGPRADEAAGVLLGRAPGAGRSRTLTAQAVGLRLEEEGFDARRIEFGGAEEAMVRSAADAHPAAAAPAAAAAQSAKPAASPAPAAPAVAAQRVAAEEELKRLSAGWLRSSLAGRLHCSEQDLDVHVLSAQAPKLSGDAAGAKAAVQWASGTLRLGRQNATILLSDENDKPFGRVQVVLDAAVLRTVPVACADLQPGRVLAADDFAQARVRLTDLGMELPADPKELVGMVASRAIRAGSPIDMRMLARQMLVRRGQPVTMLCQAGGVQITETVMARADGALGDVVAVERIGARRQQIVGVVAGQALVKVE